MTVVQRPVKARVMVRFHPWEPVLKRGKDMKDFFTWYLVASIIGVWSLVAYAFYRISRMSEWLAQRK